MKSARFLRKHHHGISRTQWNDWHWQYRNTLRQAADLERVFHLSPDEQAALYHKEGGLPVSITPYYAAQIDATNPTHALRRTMIPVMAETIHSKGEEEDPLGEDNQSPTPCLVHRYPDRVLFMTTGQCSAYCRYCTRTRLVGGCGRPLYARTEWEKAIAYIQEHTEIRDVILSGGDPLTLGDETLEWLMQQVRDIPHVEVIRIGTKIPAVLPMRITPALTRMLRKYHPLWMSIHFTHPDELTAETEEACIRLADAGIPLGSQTVLLAGINDDAEVLARLFKGLMRVRVRPYYLYQCDPIQGSSHFRTPVQKGLEIMRALRGYISGYAVPTFVVDAPGGGGKIPMLPDYVTGHDENVLHLTNYKGNPYQYPDAVP